jgi:uncharacterized membrane protein YhaH (DUF805 family)
LAAYLVGYFALWFLAMLISGPIGVIAAFAGTMVLVLAYWAAIVRRFHDLASSGWRALLLVVPIVNIFILGRLLFSRPAPEVTEWDNPTGERPELRAVTTVVAGLVLVGGYMGWANFDLFNEMWAGAYPRVVVENYMGPCVEGSTASGVPLVRARNYCKCTIDEIERRFTLAEFARMEEQIVRTNVIPDEFAEVIDICVARTTSP